MKDVIIIGAGIIGSFIAFDLSKYHLDVIVLEKNSDIASGTSKANSAIIHSGHDPKPNTLKAKFNVLGSRMYEDICASLNCHYEKVGAYVLACGKEEEDILMQLETQAKERNIPYEIHNRNTILIKEENISEAVSLGLYLPTTAIFTPWEVAIALMDNAIYRGTQLYLDHEVTHIEKLEEGYRVYCHDEIFEAKVLINCAGIHADDIANMAGSKMQYQIQAKRGEYFILDKLHKPLVHSILFPVPSSKGKGILVAPTIHGNYLLGPTSYVIDEKEDVSTTKEGLDSIRLRVNKLVKNVPMKQVIRTFSGNRPSGNTHDFIIQEDKDLTNFIHVSCIESPGLASAPAISQYVVEELVKKCISCEEKENIPPILQRKKTLQEMSFEERVEKIKEDARYGHVICRCEQISEKEIMEAIHSYTPCTSVGAIKRRLRPGMGRCQGGFCEALIIKILARELGKSECEIQRENQGSQILVSKR